MMWEVFSTVDVGIKGEPLTKSDGQEVITWKRREGKLKNGQVDLQAAHPSRCDQHLKGYWQLEDSLRLECTNGCYTHRCKL